MVITFTFNSSFLYVSSFCLTSTVNTYYLFVYLLPTSAWGWNLTNRTRLLPDPLHRLRKTVDLNLQEIKYPGVTHIIVKIAPNDLEKYVAVNVDLYFHDTRVIPIRGSVPLLKDLLSKPRVKQSDIGQVRYYATLLDVMNVITVEMKAFECTDPKLHAVVELLEPWSVGVTQIQFFTVL